MPRLLLVDENASIRRSAEILLGGTDVELVALESAAEALARLDSGETFDVALLHAFLPGEMDGWALLDRLRATPATARMPIALMAGVLKEVDPVQIAEAPIQGFLRKPIELGNLRDRLATLMATPVPDPPPPAEAAVPGPAEDTPADLPDSRAQEVPVELDDDLLILEAQDLYPGDTTPAPLAAEAPSLELESPGEDSLELEELDLEALKSLEPATHAAWPEPTPEGVPAAADLEPTWGEVPEALHPPVPEPMDELMASLASSEGTVETTELESEEELDLGAEFEPGFEAVAQPQWTEPVASMVPDLPSEALPAPHPEPAPEPVSAFQEPAAPALAPVLAQGADPQALVQALVSNPAALDALCRAVVAELGDRTLREIAWEIMPDLAEKLRR